MATDYHRMSISQETYVIAERLKFLSNVDEIKINMQEKRIESEIRSLGQCLLPDLLNIIKQYAMPVRLWKWHDTENRSQSQSNIKDLREIGKRCNAKPNITQRWMTLEDAQTKLFITTSNSPCTCCMEFDWCGVTGHVSNATLCSLVASGAMSYKCELYKFGSTSVTNDKSTQTYNLPTHHQAREARRTPLEAVILSLCRQL